MLEEPPTAAEQYVLQHITALIKNYEPQFELRANFTPGLFGCSDPQYPAVRKQWLHGLVQKGLMEEKFLSLQESFDDLIRDDQRRSTEADSRLNWRVTIHHADYRIHIMALDKSFQSFALSLQTENNFLEGLGSRSGRPPCYRYEVVNHLSELKPILDDIYEIFKRWEEERRQQDRIDKAVAKERDRWAERLDNERNKRQQIGYLVAFIVVAFVIIGVNEHFHGVPGDVFGTALGAGIGALFCAALFFWGLVWFGSKFGILEEGKATPRTMRIIIASSAVVFFGLWATLIYLVVHGLI